MANNRVICRASGFIREGQLVSRDGVDENSLARVRAADEVDLKDNYVGWATERAEPSQLVTVDLVPHSGNEFEWQVKRARKYANQKSDNSDS